MRKKANIPDIVIEDAIKIRFNTSRLNKRLEEAQNNLVVAIAEDIKPYMPMLTGGLIQRASNWSGAHIGDGQVMIAPAPYGRYLYEGKVMVNASTGNGARPIKLKTGETIFRHEKGATLVPTSRPLKYTRAGAVPHWYEEAKKANWDRWMQLVEDTVGGKITRGNR